MTQTMEKLQRYLKELNTNSSHTWGRMFHVGAPESAKSWSGVSAVCYKNKQVDRDRRKKIKQRKTRKNNNS